MFVLQLASTMILARILSPADYGINAMAVAITGFANIFNNLGLSTATIQRADITHEQVSTLFWINASIGALLTVLIAALSPTVAWFYNTPEMLWVMLALSIIFTISGLSVQHSALLTRQMRFYSIAKIRILSLFTGILVAIVTGYYGFGYWSLVFNTLTSTTLSTAGFWVACRWVPGTPRSNTGVGSMIKFGADLVCFDVVNYFARNLDNILIGRYWGSGSLGFYSKAYQLLMMPITNLRGPVTSVAMPALSRLQKEPDQYREYYLKCVSLLAFVSMPLVAFMFACAEPLIIFLLGSQWLGANEIFKILAIAAFIQPVSSTTGMVLISTGQSRRYLKIGFFSSFLFCISFVAGLPWGPKGVALGYTLMNYIILFPMLIYSFEQTSVSIYDFLLAVLRPLIASISMGIIVYFFLDSFTNNISYIFSIILILSIAITIYIILYLAIPGGLKDFKIYYSYFYLILKKEKT
jgi:PST family polysaccharide transporter